MRWWIDLERWFHPGHAASYAHEWWAKGMGGTPTACPGGDMVAALGFLHGHV
jgi:hypothetical protein